VAGGFGTGFSSVLGSQRGVMRPPSIGAGTTVHVLSRFALDRIAYCRLLVDALQLHVVADTDFRPASVWAAMRCHPDLVLVHADLPTTDVVEALNIVARLRPEACIIAVSAAIEPQDVEAWGRCPLHGYVAKEGGMKELQAAVRALIVGNEYFSAGTRAAFTRGVASVRGVKQLSRREAELLPLLARGLTLREAARQMAITYKTADYHRTNLLRKLGVRDRVELTRYAIREGLIKP